MVAIPALLRGARTSEQQLLGELWLTGMIPAKCGFSLTGAQVPVRVTKRRTPVTRHLTAFLSAVQWKVEALKPATGGLDPGYSPGVRLLPRPRHPLPPPAAARGAAASCDGEGASVDGADGHREAATGAGAAPRGPGPASEPPPGRCDQPRAAEPRPASAARGTLGSPPAPVLQLPILPSARLNGADARWRRTRMPPVAAASRSSSALAGERTGGPRTGPPSFRRAARFWGCRGSAAERGCLPGWAGGVAPGRGAGLGERGAGRAVGLRAAWPGLRSLTPRRGWLAAAAALGPPGVQARACSAAGASIGSDGLRAPQLRGEVRRWLELRILPGDAVSLPNSLNRIRGAVQNKSSAQVSYSLREIYQLETSLHFFLILS